MGSITFRIRSIVWFVTGALLATTVTLMFVNAWRADAAPGDIDTTFVAITPCRLADTRPAPDRVGTADALGADDTQTFAVHGSNGECTIPTDAVAVSVNVTAVGASVESFLTLWPDGDLPLVSSLNPAPGEPPTPNAVTVSLSAAGGFNLYNFVGSVNVVIDVNGYHTRASLADLDARLAALETATAANAAQVALLDEAQPFAVTERDDVEFLTSTAAVVVSVEVTAPVDGQVTVNSSSRIGADPFSGSMRCSIDIGTDLDFDHLQWWYAPPSPTASVLGQMNTTRMFDIDANSTVAYNLVCDFSGVSANMRDSVLTAIFTPA